MQHVRMAWIGIHRQPPQRRQCARTLRQPFAMHTVARPEYVAADQALMRLHQIVMRVLQMPADRPAEAPVPPGTAQIPGRELDDLLRRIPVPFAGYQRDVGTLFYECPGRTADETLGPACRIVFLADQCDAGCAQSVS